MPETIEPGVLQELEPKRKLKVKTSDIIIFAVIILVCVGMVVFIVHRLSVKHQVLALKREAAEAQVTSDKVVAAMSKQDVEAIQAMGDKTFQADHTTAELSSDLTFQTTPPITFAQMYGDSKPKVDQQIVVNNSKGQHVALVYVYNKLKVPFYVRIDTLKPPHDNKWSLQALSASSNESSLLSSSN